MSVDASACRSRPPDAPPRPGRGPVTGRLARSRVGRGSAAGRARVGWLPAGGADRRSRYGSGSSERGKWGHCPVRRGLGAISVRGDGPNVSGSRRRLPPTRAPATAGTAAGTMRPNLSHLIGPGNHATPGAGPRVCDVGQGAGGATGIRTPDLLNAIQTLFQLSYSPVRPEAEYSGSRRSDREWPCSLMQGHCGSSVSPDEGEPDVERQGAAARGARVPPPDRVCRRRGPRCATIRACPSTC